ncbi:MAG: hypothetical protein ACLU9V_00595 [Roseburia sp.]
MQIETYLLFPGRQGSCIVNAEYLLMLSQVTGTKSVYLSEKRPEKSIIYGSGENGAFIVLPVSFTEEDQKNFWME